MNIIYLHCHDAGRYLSPYGYPVSTPHLESFAEESVVFRQAHCAAPTCSPSRAALLTGQTAHESGMLGLAHRGFRLKDPDQLLARFLRNQHGYQTYLAGIQHVFDFHAQDIEDTYDQVLAPHNRGFAMSDPARDQMIAHAAADFLHSRRKTEPPFLLECGFFHPHRTFPDADPAFKPDRLQPPARLPDVPAVREDMAGFQTAVTHMDRAFGVMWDALQAGGWTENSLIFFTTDHGIPYPHCKCNLTDHGTGVALMMRLPGNPPTPACCDALVSHLDVFPTLCEYLNIPAPAWLQGHSLRPLLEAQDIRIRDRVFSEVTYHAGYEPKRAVRTDRYLYIRNFESEFHPALANMDGGLAKSWMHEQQLLPYPVAEEELYDVLQDPQQAHSLCGLPDWQEVLTDMRNVLHAWMQETDDPLLQGHVPVPEGAVVTPAGSVDP